MRAKKWGLSVFFIALALAIGGCGESKNDRRYEEGARNFYPWGATGPSRSSYTLAQLRDKVLKESSFPAINRAIRFKHSLSQPVEDRCKILFFNTDCYRVEGEELRRYTRDGEGTVTLSGSFGGTDVSESTAQDYRNTVMSYLRHTVLGGEGAQITWLSLSGSTSWVLLSNAVGGRGASGEAFQVSYGTSVYIFSFDVPLEANPIYEWETTINEDEEGERTISYRKTYLNGISTSW